MTIEIENEYFHIILSLVLLILVILEIFVARTVCTVFYRTDKNGNSSNLEVLVEVN